MQPSDQSVFSDAMLKLRDSYPSAKFASADFRKTLEQYFSQLRDLPAEAVLEATRLAPRPEYYPDWFPNAGQLRRVAQTLAADQARRVTQHSWDDRELTPIEYYADVPQDEQELVAWIAAAPNAFEALARKWKAESRDLWLDPNRPPPRAIVEKRMAEFWTMWAEKCGDVA